MRVPDVLTAPHVYVKKNVSNKFTLNVLIGWGVDLDGFDKIGGCVGHLFGRLNKLPSGHGVGCLGGGKAARVTECRGVLGYDGCCGQDLMNKRRENVSE